MWAENKRGNFDCLKMRRGAGQGGPESTPLYCVLAAAQTAQLQSFAKANAIAARQCTLVDDFIFQASSGSAPAVVAECERSCAEAGIQLVRSKRTAYWPLDVDARRDDSPIAMRRLETQKLITSAIAVAVQTTTDHITVLGNAVGG